MKSYRASIEISSEQALYMGFVSSSTGAGVEGVGMAEAILLASGTGELDVVDWVDLAGKIPQPVSTKQRPVIAPKPNADLSNMYLFLSDCSI